MPPPSVRPPTPVLETKPLGVASPKGCVAWSTSPHTQPPSTRTVRLAASTCMPFMRERSTTRPSSTVPRPGPLWPPPRTARVSLLLAGKIDRADDIGDIHAADDERRVFVDHAIVDFARLVILRVAWTDQVAAHAASSGLQPLHHPRHSSPAEPSLSSLSFLPSQ